MSPLLIQYLFFLSICTMTHGMDTNSGQKNIVRSMLNNNNEKLQNWDFGLTAKPARINKPTRTKMQPLPQDLQLDPITIITNHAHKTGNGSLLCSLYNNVAPGMVYESCVLKPETEKFHKTINKSMKELAKTNITAQIYVAQKLVDQCVPLFNDAAFLLQTEKQEIKYALELFGFLHPLAEEKKLITPESLKGKINTIKREVCPSVSYILHACRCLQAVTHTEKETTLFHFKNQRCPNNSEIEAICQFLINYGDATLSPEESAKKFLRSITTYPQLLYKITQPSLNSHIIAKLRNVQLNANDPLFPLLNYVLAEFYFHDKDYHNAHTYYSKNSAGYLCHKKLSLKALIACIASTENFSLETISYLLSLRNICHKLIKIKQSNPKLSYNIGLFVRALFNNKPFIFNSQTQSSLLTIALDHLTYAQKNGHWNKEELTTLATMRVEFHTFLSNIYATEKQPAMSLKHIKQALEYRAAYSNNTQDCTILTLLEQAEKNNPDLYQKHTPVIATVLQLIYNHAQQNDNAVQNNYNSLIECGASYDLCQQLLPYLECAYTTNKKNKDQIAYLLALFYQHNGNYLKAYNYKRILPQDSSYLTQLHTGMFALDEKKDAQIIIYALNMLEENKIHADDPITKPMCQFVLNELPAESFIKLITSQKNISQSIAEIAQSPFCAKIIALLHDAALETNNPLLPQINCLLAEFYYHSNKPSKAHEFYITLPKNSLLGAAYRTIRSNAFNACIENTIKFDEKTINYLSCLSGNIGNKLQTIQLTDPRKSYHVVLLIDALLQTNPKMNVLDKIDFVINGLNHLTYTQNSDIWNEKIKSIMAHTSAEFNLLLSHLYPAQKNYTAALKHYKNALEYRASRSNNIQDSQIVSILMQAEQNNPELYAQYALLIQNLLHFIDNEVQKIEPQKNNSLLSQFTSYDLCQQLIPYCETSYTANKQSCNDVFYLMALCDKNNGNYESARDYIDKLENPTNGILSLKATIYALAKKTLPFTELETIFKLYSNDKKQPSKEEKWTILSHIASSSDFFTETQNYALALKLITKLTDKNIPPAIIMLAYHIEKHLITTQNPYFKDWLKDLVDRKVYDEFKNATCYSGKINAAISFLLIQQEPVASYEKIIEHLTAAINSKELPTDASLENICAKVYYDWAVTVAHDTDTCLQLLDKALEYNNNDVYRYEKAFFILNNNSDTDLINHALELLEENIKNDGPTKLLSLQHLIPLNTNKAIMYLKDHHNDQSLLELLCNIFGGTSSYIDEEKTEQYINLQEALSCINLLIDTYGSTIDYRAFRMHLFIKLNQPEKALHDIDFMLKAQDLSNKSGITTEYLLQRKLNILQTGTLDDNAYNQMLECCRQISLTNNVVVFDSPILQDRTQHLIATNNTTREAIDWCCFNAGSIIRKNIPLSSIPPATKEQKELANYLLSAAKKGNLNAQLIILPYCDAIDYYNEINHYEVLNCTHAAIMNPNSNKQNVKLNMLVELLHQFTEQGVALPYYILCDYYKNNREQLEKTMLLFSKSKKQLHYLDDITDTVQKIAFSCKPVFMPSIDRCMKSKNPSLMDALATFTFGAMCDYSDDADALKGATAYLLAAYPLCNGKLNLPHYKVPLHTLLADVYYKRALVTEKTTKKFDLEMMRESANFGHLPPIHAIAAKYIQQHETGKLDITEEDFLPLLERDVQISNPCNPRSLELLEKCIAIKDKINTEKIANNTINSPVQATPVPQEKRMSELNIIANQKKMLKNINYKETYSNYAKILDLYTQGNKKLAGELLQKTIAQNKNHACTLMMFAFSCLTGEVTPQDYIKSGEFLAKALTYGLVIKSRKDTTKQFQNVHFLDQLLLYIKALVTKNYPVETTFDLLTIIKTMLENNGVDMADFYEVFYKITAIKLEKTKWSGKENKQALTTTTEKTLITKEQPQSSPIDMGEELASQLNDLFKITDESTNSSPQVKSVSPKISQNYLDALNAYEQGDNSKGLTLMEYVATQEKNPFACAVLTSKYFTGDGVPKRDYLLSAKYLSDALSYGLVEKPYPLTGKEFYGIFLTSLCTLIKTIVTTVHQPSAIQEHLIATLKKDLITNGINLTQFCEIVRDKTKINLPDHAGWLPTKELKAPIKNSTINSSPQVKAVPKERRIAELTKITLKNKMIKHTNYIETYPKLVMAMNLYGQHRPEEADQLLQQVVKTQKNHTCALMQFALRQLTQGLTTKDYTLTKKTLTQALNHGLVITSVRDKTKQFHNIYFLDTLCWYLESLLTEKHPLEVAHDLVSMIKKSFENGYMPFTPFEELFKTLTGINLPSSIQWSMEMAVFDISDGSPLGNALDDYSTSKKLPETTLPVIAEKSTDLTLKKAVTGKERLALLGKIANEKKMLKNSVYTETCLKLSQAVISYGQGLTEKGDQLLQQAIKEQPNNPYGLMKYAQRHLAQALTTKNYVPTKKLLTRALSNGIVLKETHEKNWDYNFKTKQFHNPHFLNEFFWYIESLLIDQHPLETKFELITVITTALGKSNGINLTDFCELFQTITGTNLAEWSVKTHVVNGSDKSEESCRETFEKSTGTKLPVIAEEPQKKKPKLASSLDLRKSMINNPDYKETSTDFLSALKTYEQKDRQKALALMYYAATHKHHPCAYIICAANYFLGDDVETNIPLSEQFLCNALSYGLIGKQFCTGDFLSGVCNYIELVITTPNESSIKERLFSVIKKILISHDVDLIQLCKIMHEEKNINLLLFFPEWIDTRPSTTPKPIQVNNLNDCFKAIEEKNNKAQQISIMDLKKSMINSTGNLSPLLIKALGDYNKEQTTKHLAIMQSLAIKEQNPNVHLFIACIYLAGERVEKNILLAEEFLRNGLCYGLTKQQFCNDNCIDILCSCIDIIITGKHSPQEKQHLCSIVREAFKVNDINLSKFYEIVHAETKLILSLTPEWLGVEKPQGNHEQISSKIDQMVDGKNTEEIISALDKLLSNDNESAVISMIDELSQIDKPSQDKKTTSEQPTIADIERSMIKEPDDNTAANDIAKATANYNAAMQAHQERNTKKFLEYTNKAIKDKNPSASLCMASEHALGYIVQKNYKLSEQFLCNALAYGLVAQKFCSRTFLHTLFGYIKDIITHIPSKQRLQYLLTIIRKALEKNNINLIDFCTLFEATTKLKLSFS